MEKLKFMPELSNRERIQAMQDTAIHVEDDSYYVPLTQAALDLKREQFTDNSIYLGKKKAEIKELVDNLKEEIKPKVEESAKLLQEITTKQEKREGTVYHLPDYDRSMVVSYDQDGECVGERRMRPDEKSGQSRMFVPSGFKKDGTNN